MYKEYKMSEVSVGMESWVVMGRNDIWGDVNDIVERIDENELEELRDEGGGSW